MGQQAGTVIVPRTGGSAQYAKSKPGGADACLNLAVDACNGDGVEIAEWVESIGATDCRKNLRG